CRSARDATASPPRCRAARSSSSRAALEREAVELRGVLADDLAADVGGQVAQLALHVLARVRPHAVGMRKVRAPHDLVDAELVDELDPDRIRLVRGPALPLPVL